MSNAQDFVTSFMKNLAGEGVELTQALQAVFAKILAEQVVVDADTSVVSFKPAFSTLLKVLTFIATPEAERPEAGSSYTQEAIDTAADSAATDTGLTLGEEIPTEAPTEEPTDGPTDEPTEEPTDGPTDEPTEEPGVEGNTLELTTGADVIAPLAEGEEAVEGVQYTTENDDVINGLAGSYATTTLNKDDQIDGGAGNDTLNVELTSKFGGFTGDGFLKNVETVNLTNTGTSSRVFDAKQVEGVETYNLDGMVDLNTLNSADIAVNVANRASGTVKIGYGEKVTEGTEDVLNLGITNLGSAATKEGTEDIKVTVEAAGIETLNLNATGANFVTLNTADVKDINVKGAGSLKLNGLGAKVEAIDASALEGKLNLDLAGTTTGVTSVKGGAGDDVITANAANLKVNSTIDGGAGQDTLVLNKNATTTLQLDMVGVETIKLVDTTALTYSATKTAGLENLIVTGTISGDSNFASMEGDLNVTLEKAVSGSVSSDHDGVTTVNIAGEGTKDAVANNTTGLSFSKTANLDVTVAAFNEYAGKISAAAAEAANLTLNGTVGSSTTSGSLSLDAAESLVINDNNKGADTLILTADKLLDLTLNVNGAAGSAAVDFTLDSGSSVKGLKALNINTDGAVDTSSGDAMAEIADITLNGMGSVKLGDLGATDAEDNINITAVGLAKGLTTGDINTGAGNSVDIDVSGVLGSVDLASSGGITVANGSITITAEGTAGAIELGTLKAKTVTIDAGDALGKIGATTAAVIEADEVSFTGSSIAANEVKVTAAKATIVGSLVADKIEVKGAAGTDVVATLTGGLGADTFNIVASSVAATAKMIVTITDFNAGEDILQLGGAAFSAATAMTLGTAAFAKLNSSSSKDTFTASSITDKAATGTGGDGVITLLNTGTAATKAQEAFFAQFNAFDSTLNFTASNTKLAKVDLDGTGTAFVTGLMNNGDFYTFNKVAGSASSVLVKLVGVTAEESYDFVFAADWTA